MPSKKHKPEEIIGKLREVEIVLAQGASTAEACRGIAVSEHLSPLVQGIWWSEDRPGAANEGFGEGESAASPGDLRPDAGQANIAGGRTGKLLSPARRRRCIDHVRRELLVSERRICRVLGQHRSTQRKVPRGADDEQALTEDIIALAKQYGRYGYRRVTALLCHAGWTVNHKALLSNCVHAM